MSGASGGKFLQGASQCTRGFGYAAARVPGEIIELLEGRGGGVKILPGFGGFFSRLCRLKISSGLNKCLMQKAPLSAVFRFLELPFTQVKGKLTCLTSQRGRSHAFQLGKGLG